MKTPPITATIITLNEENSLPRTLESLKWVDEIVVVDSGSTDRTVALAQAAGARVIHHPWPGYGAQKNYAQDQAKNDWVLNVDADEVITPELASQIQTALTNLPAESGPRGFYFPRKTFYLGRWIRHGGWYPNHLVRLAHRKFSRWTEPQIHENLKVQGLVLGLTAPLHHYTFTSIEDQVLTNLRYSRFGSVDLQQKGKTASLFMLLLKPCGKFLETYVVKKGFLDGLPGFLISVNAAHSIFLKYAYLFEEKFHESPRS